MSQEYTPGLITVLGIDGTGKTSTSGEVSLLLAERGLLVVNYDEYEKESPIKNPYKRIKAEVKEKSVEEQFLVFLLSTLWHSSQIQNLIKEDKIVVKSRYLLDVAAHHSHLGLSNAEDIIKPLPFLQPSLQTVLFLEEAERQERILSRKIIEDQDLIKKEPGTRAWFFENYLLEKSKVIHPDSKILLIDTTEDSIVKVSMRIAQAFLGEI